MWSHTYRIFEGVLVAILLQMAGNELSFCDFVVCRGQLVVIRFLGQFPWAENLCAQGLFHVHGQELVPA